MLSNELLDLLQYVVKSIAVTSDGTPFALPAVW